MKNNLAASRATAAPGQVRNSHERATHEPKLSVDTCNPSRLTTIYAQKAAV